MCYLMLKKELNLRASPSRISPTLSASFSIFFGCFSINVTDNQCRLLGGVLVQEDATAGVLMGSAGSLTTSLVSCLVCLLSREVYAPPRLSKTKGPVPVGGHGPCVWFVQSL